MRSAAPIPDHGGSAPAPLRLEPAIDAAPRDPEVVAQMSPAVTDPAWLTAEEGRLQEARAGVPWRRWGPYLSERQWAEFPYADLVAVNRSRSREEMEYELVDTGVFGEDRYFDVEVEHAKAGPEDILCRVTVHNRSAQDAALHVLPTLWFRNTWSLGDDERQPRLTRAGSAHPVIRAEHDELGVLHLHAEPEASLLFCENETNTARLWGKESTTRFAKDGIGDCVLHGADTVNPAGEGTKAAAHIRLEVPAGGQAAVLVRLTREGPEELPAPFADADGLITGAGPRLAARAQLPPAAGARASGKPQ